LIQITQSQFQHGPPHDDSASLSWLYDLICVASGATFAAIASDDAQS